MLVHTTVISLDLFIVLQVDDLGHVFRALGDALASVDVEVLTTVRARSVGLDRSTKLLVLWRRALDATELDLVSTAGLSSVHLGIVIDLSLLVHLLSLLSAIKLR